MAVFWAVLKTTGVLALLVGFLALIAWAPLVLLGIMCALVLAWFAYGVFMEFLHAEQQRAAFKKAIREQDERFKSRFAEDQAALDAIRKRMKELEDERTATDQ